MSVVEAELDGQGVQQYSFGGVAILEHKLISTGPFRQKRQLAPQAFRRRILDCMRSDIGRGPAVQMSTHHAGARVHPHVVHVRVGHMVVVDEAGEGGLVFGEEKVKGDSSETWLMRRRKTEIQVDINEGVVKIVSPGQGVKLKVHIHGLRYLLVLVMMLMLMLTDDIVRPHIMVALSISEPVEGVIVMLPLAVD